jgi:predicted RNA-binding Zn ribbon-like protein
MLPHAAQHVKSAFDGYTETAIVRLENLVSGGASRPPCLALANTVRWHASDHPEETLRSYAGLVAWARAAEMLTTPAARRLLHAAADRPAEAARVLKRAVALRETIYRIFVALIHKRPPAGSDLDGLNRALAHSAGCARVVKTAKGFARTWGTDDAALDSLLAPLAFSAAELLVSEGRERVGQCADDRGCGWLFLDTSKNRTRRWCDINDCGNRAKQRRHYERTKKRR